MNQENIIIVCSKNKAKNEAVKNVMRDYFENFEIKSLKTESKVSETPIGDEEGILGCRNRIYDAISQDSTGNLYIAMEGILTKTFCGTFLCGWTVIYNKPLDEYYYGCSAKVKIPDEIIEKMTKSTRLSSIVGKYMNSSDEKVSNYGTNGILTNGAYTRTDEFIDSVLCAISTKFKKMSKIGN